MRPGIRLTAITMLALVASVVQAAPVTWVLTGATFSDGSSLTGSFSYDADTNTYSDVNLVSDILDYGLDGDVQPSLATELHIYQDISPYPDCIYRDTLEYPTCSDVHLYFAESLTSAGGTVSLLTPSSYEYWHDNFNNTISRSLVSGSVVANVVPVPAAVWLFGSALAGLGWLRRKQAS